MVNKNVGILTFHHVVNEGAVLQAYSQALALENILDEDYKVEIIDYRTFIKEYSEIRTLVANFVKMKKPIVNLKRHLKTKSFIKRELPLSKEKLISDNYEKAIEFIDNKYDAIVVGSDELWKVLDGRYSRKFPNIYWLSKKIKSKKYASAVSANRFNYYDADENIINHMKKCLNDFDLVGVRDDHTLKFLDYLKLESDKIFKVPDPTFSLELDNEFHKTTKDKMVSKGVDFSKPIAALAYSSSGDRKSKFSKIVKKYLKDKGFQIVSISMGNYYSDIYLQDVFNPLEWGHSFKHFDLCITDRFHGTIFSLKNNTPFLTIDHEDRYTKLKSKTTDILTELGLMNHHLNIIDGNYKKELFNKLNKILEKNQYDYDLSILKNKYFQHLNRIKNDLESQ